MPTITILESSPRAANLLHIFGRLTDIPISSPFPIRVHVPDHQNALAYLLDVSLITPEERLRLVNHLAKYFSLTHADPQGIALSMSMSEWDYEEDDDGHECPCGCEGDDSKCVYTPSWGKRQ